MNIVIINSSPKKEKSFSLRIAKYLTSRIDGSQVKVINLYSKKIDECNGCITCQSGEKCILNDDLREILEDINLSDLIIFATPVYFFHVNSIMKKIIDRLSNWGYKSSSLLGKYSMIITTADGYGTKNVTNYFKTFFSFQGMIFCGELICNKFEIMKYRKPGSRFQKQLENTLNKFNKIYNSFYYKPTFNDYFGFFFRKRMVTINNKLYPGDYEYWKNNDLLDKNYFKLEGKIIKSSFFIKILVKILILLILKKV